MFKISLLQGNKAVLNGRPVSEIPIKKNFKIVDDILEITSKGNLIKREKFDSNIKICYHINRFADNLIAN